MADNFAARAAMIEWLEEHCPSKMEYDFWFDFYDDLDDCFDDCEPWRMFGGPAYTGDTGWHSWDLKFTGRMIPEDPPDVPL